MTLLSRIENIQKLWAIMLLHIPPPEPAWFGRWCEYEDALIEKAIVRLSKKFRSNEPPTEPEIVWRYAFGVVQNQARAIEEMRLQTEREKAARKEAERLKNRKTA